jgi:hypothetical protein
MGHDFGFLHPMDSVASSVLTLQAVQSHSSQLNFDSIWDSVAKITEPYMPPGPESNTSIIPNEHEQGEEDEQ